MKDYKSAAEVPVAQFFALEDFRNMKLSPDGKRIATGGAVPRGAATC